MPSSSSCHCVCVRAACVIYNLSLRVPSRCLSQVGMRDSEADITTARFRRKMSTWWTYARFVVMGGLLAMGVGVFFFFGVLVKLDRLKFQDAEDWTSRKILQNVLVAGVTTMTTMFLGFSIRPLKRLSMRSWNASHNAASGQ